MVWSFDGAEDEKEILILVDGIGLEEDVPI